MRTQIPGQEKNVCSAVPGSAFWCEQPSSSWNARWLLVLPVGLQYAQTKTLLLLLNGIKDTYISINKLGIQWFLRANQGRLINLASCLINEL